MIGETGVEKSLIAMLASQLASVMSGTILQNNKTIGEKYSVMTWRTRGDNDEGRLGSRTIARNETVKTV